jgi:hypothetical protein
MMAPLDPATLVMAIPTIMTAAIIMAIVATIVTAVIAAIIAAVIAVIAITAIIVAVAAIIILCGCAAARAQRSNGKAGRCENSADLHGILSLPGDRAMTGDTITLAYRS